MNDSEDKFKFLYELSSVEYKDEIGKMYRAEEKAMKLFAVLNVIFPLLETVILKYEFWKELKEINILIFSILVFLFFLIFGCLISAWYELFQNLRNKKIEKINLNQGNDFEDIIYDDNKDMSYLYWKTYKTYQIATKNHMDSSNKLYQSLEISQNWIKRAFSLFFIFLFIIFLCYLKKVYV